jgi:hypothetical protein
MWSKVVKYSQHCTFGVIARLKTPKHGTMLYSHLCLSFLVIFYFQNSNESFICICHTYVYNISYVLLHITFFDLIILIIFNEE